MKYYLFVLVIFSALISCNNDDDQDDCWSTFETAYVQSVIAPSTGTVGETIAIDVIFSVSNGCGIFNKFEETITGNSRTITVNAEYECRPCTQAIETITVVYSFTPSASGDYELKFESGENQYIIVNVNIQ